MLKCKLYNWYSIKENLSENPNIRIQMKSKHALDCYHKHWWCVEFIIDPKLTLQQLWSVAPVELYFFNHKKYTRDFVFQKLFTINKMSHLIIHCCLILYYRQRVIVLKTSKNWKPQSFVVDDFLVHELRIIVHRGRVM